jgi:hypothetical protein
MDNPNRRADDKRAPGQLHWGESVGSALAGAGFTATINAAPVLVPDIVMHGLRITKDGIIYNGQEVKDAGAVHAALMDVLSGKPLAPAAPSAASIEGLTDARIGELYLSTKHIGHATNRELAFARAIELEFLATQSAKQGAQPDTSKPTDISERLREYAANPGYSHNDYADTMRAAAEEIERYYGGMLAWKKTAEKKDRDWASERTARIDDRCAARAASQAAPEQANQSEEVLALHRQLAGEKLRADRAETRADSKSKECIELRERMAAQVQADVRDEAEKLAPILRGMCEGGGEERDVDIYADDYQAGDGDTFVIRAAQLLEEVSAMKSKRAASTDGEARDAT